MSYTVRDKFAVYKVTPSTAQSAHVWITLSYIKQATTNKTRRTHSHYKTQLNSSIKRN